MSGIRVLYFLETFGLGGIESFVVSALEHRQSSEIFVDCCVGRKTTANFDVRINSLDTAFIDLNVDFDGFPGVRYEKAAKALASYLRRSHYDIVHIHANHGVDYLFARVAKCCGVEAVILHSHNSGVTKGAYKTLGHTAFKAVFHESVDSYYSCSVGAAQWLFPNNVFANGRYTIIPNGIDLSSYRFDSAARIAVRKELGLSDMMVYGHIGRFNYQKNHRFLIDVFARVHRTNPAAHLVLVGEGELEQEVKRKVFELGIDDAVTFTGPRYDVPKLLSAFDALLFPSRFEGLSIALVEAQAANLPIITTDTVSSETILSDNITLLPLEVDVWVDAVVGMQPYSDRCTRQDARLRSFDISRSIELIDKGYLKLVSG